MACGRAILRDQVDFAHRHWRGISGDAKHFVSLLLAKDAAARPTAKQVGAWPYASSPSPGQLKQ